MKATTLLACQHRNILVLLGALQVERHASQALLLSAVEQLSAHVTAATCLFYPKASSIGRFDVRAHEELNEAIRKALVEATRASLQNEDLNPAVGVLKDLFERHIAIEEKLIGVMDKIVPTRDLEELGADMQVFSDALARAYRKTG